MKQIPSAEASVEEIVNIMHGVAQSHVPRSAFYRNCSSATAEFYYKSK